MIDRFVLGNIQDGAEDIILAMNTEAGELSVLGQRFLASYVWPSGGLIPFGTVLSFEIPSTTMSRRIHFIVCHHLHEGGWNSADKFIAYGLQQLWLNYGFRSFATVRMGNGTVGKKYGADAAAILAAIASSPLPLVLYLRTDRVAELATHSEPLRLKFWGRLDPEEGKLLDV